MKTGEEDSAATQVQEKYLIRLLELRSFRGIAGIGYEALKSHTKTDETIFGVNYP